MFLLLVYICVRKHHLSLTEISVDLSMNRVNLPYTEYQKQSNGSVSRLSIANKPLANR